jgi:bifunctional enzyme CysN/CysC
VADTLTAPPTDELDVESWLSAQDKKDLLRFITCGSVDDGKSTLIGRLLYDSRMVLEDQLAALERDSKVSGTQGDDLDFALLVDGLSAEREQGITIDVAYRFFSTDKRKFIVADTPGHEQYTRNMVTGASTADAAVILIDARKGVLTQSRRHSYLVSLVGIDQIVLAINKMDLVGWSQEIFDTIVAEYMDFARLVGLKTVQAIPMSALRGDNIAQRSDAAPWYQGPALLEHLEAIPPATTPVDDPFYMPVQWVNRPDLDFRGYAGFVVSGQARPGDRVRVAPSGRESRIARIVTQDGDLTAAMAGQSVTITLHDQVDISRGDVLMAADAPLEIADQFEANIVWMSAEPLLPGRAYLMKIGAQTVSAQITEIKHRVDIDTLEHMAAKVLHLNEIAACNLSINRAIPFASYAQNRDLGSFILIDRMTNATVGAGTMAFALRRAHNIHWQALSVDKTARAGLKHQKPAALWFTGLSGAGKSTIANLVEKRLLSLGRHTILLDGDNVRHGLNRDLGFTEADRVENIRRVSEVAKLMTEAGLIVLVSFISPFRAERRMAREMFETGEFYEIFVDAPLEVAESRDVKGLYKKARAGQLKNFTGVDSPYEPPEAPDLRIDTTALSAERAAETIVDMLDNEGLLRN